MAHNSAPWQATELRICMRVATGLRKIFKGLPGPGGVEKFDFYRFSKIFRASPRDFFIWGCPIKSLLVSCQKL